MSLQVSGEDLRASRTSLARTPGMMRQDSDDAAAAAAAAAAVAAAAAAAAALGAAALDSTQTAAIIMEPWASCVMTIHPG